MVRGILITLITVGIGFYLLGIGLQHTVTYKQMIHNRLCADSMLSIEDCQ